MIQGREGDSASVDGIIEPEALADCLMRTTDEAEFLILPHPQVLDLPASRPPTAIAGSAVSDGRAARCTASDAGGAPLQWRVFS